eukprot:6188503-Pleurochrysis_carterae.AAC.6
MAKHGYHARAHTTCSLAFERSAAMRCAINEAFKKSAKLLTELIESLVSAVHLLLKLNISRLNKDGHSGPDPNLIAGAYIVISILSPLSKQLPPALQDSCATLVRQHTRHEAN